MKNNSGTISLIISTVCVLLLNLAKLIEYWNTGYIGSTFSSICFIAGDICIIVGWIMYFVDKKTKKD